MTIITFQINDFIKVSLWLLQHQIKKCLLVLGAELDPKPNNELFRHSKSIKMQVLKISLPPNMRMAGNFSAIVSTSRWD